MTPKRVVIAGLDLPFEKKDMRFHALRLSVVILGGDTHRTFIRGPSSPYAIFEPQAGKELLMARRQLTRLPNPRHYI
jgi:hypothetical protein